MDGHTLTKDKIAALLGPRRRESNKGDNGHGLLLAGSGSMPGAACMAATAALRAGIGTLKVLCPASAAAGLCAPPTFVFHFTGGTIRTAYTAHFFFSFPFISVVVRRFLRHKF